MSKIKTKQELLEELNKFEPIIQSINDIADKVIKDENEQQTLDFIVKKIKKWRKKLSNPKFEVAIIGLEKAGKSTIANALLNQDYLPSAKARCTFTTAQIEADKNKNEAIVTFYTQNEFIDRFNALCERLQIKKLDFNSLSLEQFKKIIKEKNYIQEPNEVKDIEIMLNNKETLYSYIGKNIEVITYNIKENVKPYIVSEDRAMAVKSITIKSTELKDLEDIIIYDVPGFDSPTKIHLEQAKKYTDEADVIIMMVSIADRVSFTDTQVDFLNQTAKDGVSLIDKTIVVASKFDNHIIYGNKEGSKEEIQEYLDILNNELKKYNIYREKNIFKVSAVGYLEKNAKLEKHPTRGYLALPKLESIDMDDGYQSFRKRLSQFFEYDALKALNNNIKKDFNILENFLIDFKRKHNITNNEEKLKEDVYDLKLNYKKQRQQDLLNIVVKHKDTILQKGDFEIKSDFKKEVNNKWITTLTITDEQREEDIKSISTSGVIKATEYNINTRQKLYKKSLDILSELVSDVVITKDKEAINNFKEDIYKAFEIESNEKLKTKLDLHLEKIMGKFEYDERSYKPLVARFVNDIFRLLIENPISANPKSQRVEAFNKIRQDIEALFPFSKNYEDEIELGIYEKTLVKQILVQYEELSTAKIKDELSKYTHNIAEKIDINNLADELKNINISSNSLKKILNDNKDKLSNLSKDAIILLIKTSKSKNLLQSLMEYANEATTYEEVQNEINKDLQILQDILSNILIDAMRLDKPFIDSLNEQIEAVRRDIKDNEEIEKFIELNIEVLDRENYNKIEGDPKLNKQIENIIYSIEEQI